MCGIIGYSGSNANAVEVLLEGLEKVEYRGYDSAGIAFVTDRGIQIEKKSGKLENLKIDFVEETITKSFSKYSKISL